MTRMDSPQLETLRWIGDADGHLLLIDQTRLPLECCEIACRDVEAVWEAIRTLRVRGAPAIGIAAAYGVCLGLQQVTDGSPECAARQVACSVRLPGHQPSHSRQSVLGHWIASGNAVKNCWIVGRRPVSLRHCWLWLVRSTTKTGRCAARLVGTERNCCVTDKVC